VIRVTGDPRDIAAHLALAALDEQIGRPSDAIDELEVVVWLGGPAGVRWGADDRARLARLIAARGRARLARGAATALADLERARQLGASIGEDELRRSRIAGAIVALRHSDREVRDRGRRILVAEAAAARPATFAPSLTPAIDDVLDASHWLGARQGAPAEQRGRFGAWLWREGARRAAWDELAAWHAAAPPPHDRALEEAYLAAARWWTPLDRPGPAGARPKDEPRDATRGGVNRPALPGEPPEGGHGKAPLEIDEPRDATRGGVNHPAPGEPPEGGHGKAPLEIDDAGTAMRCAFAACPPREVAGDDAAERAYLLAPLPPPVRDPDDAAAVAVIALHQALRGEGSWGAAIAARIDLAAFASPAQRAALPAFARPVIARLAGAAPDGEPPPLDGATPDQRLMIAAGRVLAGAGPTELAGLVDGNPYAEALRAVVVPRAPFTGDARSEAAARHAARAVAGAAGVPPLHAIAAAFRRDPAIADRLAREAVAGAVDAAAMHATLGALFDAIGDPASARAEWQAAVDASPEPGFLRGLAGAQARQGDADAALITATSAAAASGDPAVVWVAVARSLTETGRHVHALEAAHSAIDLAGPDALPAALDVAIAASQALGRDRQAAQLAARRARIAPTGGTLGDRDPTDAAAVLDGYRAERGAVGDAAIARLWTAARWNPRHVELRAALLAALPAGDPRRAVIAGELVDLAGDPDPEIGRAAAAALR
jgi:tetratricopeptide (TPR) repeat protein